MSYCVDCMIEYKHGEKQFAREIQPTHDPMMALVLRLKGF